MANVRRISKKYYVRQIVSCCLVWCMLFVIPARVAAAGIGDVSGGVVVDGSATITGGGSADALIQMLSDRAVINWDCFNTDPGQLVQFLKGTGNFAVLNRIIGEGGATQFNGILQALAGDVFIVNTRGVNFGPSSYVQARNLVASGIDIKNENFMNGIYQFEKFAPTDGHPYSDLIGNVTNEGIGIEAGIHADNVALIGKNVTNRGLISAPGGTVVLAAGESVLLSDVGSNVVVEVTMPETDPGCYDYDVVHEGDGSIEAKNVILAAGDVWSMAYISAYSEAGSDAVASVAINAEGDVHISDDIEAEAYGNGVDNAIASVTINAGGSVDVKSDGYDSTTIKAKAEDGANNYADVVIAAEGDVTVSAKDGDVKIKAEAEADEYDAILNQANIELAGKNVTVQSEESGWIIDSPDDAIIYAYAHDGAENTANISLTATAEEIIDGDSVGLDGGYVMLHSLGEKGDNVLVKAEAKNGQENTAGIDITATMDVELGSCGIFDEVLVLAEAWNEIEPELEYETVVIQEEIPDVQKEITEEVANVSVEGLTNTATVDITAGGGVFVVGEASGDAAVQAIARNDIEVDIDNYDNEVTINLTVSDLKNNAGVTITAGGDVEAGAYGSSSMVGISAQAYNELEIEQNTGEWVWDGWFCGHWEDGYAATLNLDVSDLTNTANINIDSTDGDVMVVTEEGGWFDSEVLINAEAWNDLEIDLYADDDISSTGNITLDNLANNANIDITAGGDVKVLAENGGESGIAVLAANWLNPDPDASGEITADNLVNIAGVTIDADGSVKVIAECLGDCSNAYIIADAFNEGDGLTGEPSPDDIIPVNQENTATIDITAGDDVKVIGKYCGDAEISAEALSGTDNTAGVTINANGDVLVLGKYGEASIEATAMYAFNNNTATIAIDAVGGDVKVIDIGEIYDSAKIAATATDALISNNADVTITATATTSECEEDGLVYVDVDGGDVKVIAKDGGNAEITAFAETAGDIEGFDPEDSTNTANVTIRANGAEGIYYVMVEEPVYNPVEPYDLLEPAVYEAVTYTEGGDVKVIAEGDADAEIEAIAKNGYANTADVLICIEGGLTVEGDCGGEAEIEAIAKEGYSNTASVGIGAKGDDGVEVLADCGGEAGISSKAKDGYINTASTIVCTQGGVEVMATRGGDAEIFAQAIGEFMADAYVGVCAVDDVIVQAGEPDLIGCDAIIRAEAEIECEPIYFALQLPDVPVEPMEPSIANAETVVVSHEGSVEVLGLNGGNAEISSGAYGAYHNDAYTGVCAEENVRVGAYDGEAMIISEAYGYHMYRPTVAVVDDGPILPEDPTTANAETVAIAQKGYVLVADVSAFEPRTAGIISDAAYAEQNTAYTGVAAGTELTSAPIRPEEPKIDSISVDDGIILPGLDEEPLPGGVYVVALGDYSKATIDSFTSGGYENISDTVACALGEVIVYKDTDGYHSTARIKSTAEGDGITKATTQVYAREVYVEVGGLYHGSGIGAKTDSEGWIHVDDGFEFITGDLPLLMQSEENGDSMVIIDSYANKKDCPDCPVCPDCPCEEEDLGIPAMPAAPIYVEELGEGGCPSLMAWLANEIGVPGEDIQVFVTNAMAGSPGIQPCDMCARLVNASVMMQDGAGTRIAAMIEVVNEFVTTPAPPSPEQMTSIAAAFAEHVDDDTVYASAGEWIDALMAYVTILNTEMGFSTADSVAFAQKYLTPVNESGNATLTAYVQARLAAIGG